MACSELTAFRMAVESLEDGVLDSPTFARMNYFRNTFPSREFVQNQGTTRSNFTIKPSMPSDSQSLWTTVAVSGGISTPGCDPTYEDIGVDFFEPFECAARRHQVTRGSSGDGGREGHIEFAFVEMPHVEQVNIDRVQHFTRGE